MRFLKLIASVLVAGLLFSSAVFADSDPNDPLSHFKKCVVPSQQSGDEHDAFCGAHPSSPNFDEHSCFQSVSVSGCETMFGKGSATCHWSGILWALKSGMSTKSICNNQMRYCKSKHYTDCQEVFERCLSYNDGFRSKCLGR
jgi:hypothetical protein